MADAADGRLIARRLPAGVGRQELVLAHELLRSARAEADRRLAVANRQVAELEARCEGLEEELEEALRKQRQSAKQALATQHELAAALDRTHDLEDEKVRVRRICTMARRPRASARRDGHLRRCGSIGRAAIADVAGGSRATA